MKKLGLQNENIRLKNLEGFMPAFGLQREIKYKKVKIGKVSLLESDRILWFFFCQIIMGKSTESTIPEERSVAWWKGRSSIQGRSFFSA